MCLLPAYQEKDLRSTEIVQTLNSLCGTGELPTLFSNDEMNGILQVNGILQHVWLGRCDSTAFSLSKWLRRVVR